ncbi:MAG TPA: DsbA family oxidoreductase [Tepidisphaeraceae bacterium]|jgi:predicted DsbA family dithiol-disulfide isomerase
MTVIIYFDYVCPFCYLEIPALERLHREHGVVLDYRAFELRPDPVPTLDPAGDYLRTTWERSVYPLANRLGMEIHLPPVQPRSRLAFEGAELARDYDQLMAYTRAVHEAFFLHGLDIGDVDVLAEAAASVGIDPVVLREVLHDRRYLSRVLQQEQEAAQLGIASVPTVILNNYLVPGCVPYEALVKILNMKAERTTSS